MVKHSHIVVNWTILYLIISNMSGVENACYNQSVCIDGILIPVWKPLKISPIDTAIRTAIYVLSLFYIFLGVSIISDKFMSAIERITSKEKDVELMTVTGNIITIRIRVWNDTVSNLTLMALGSSAPEIMLSVIEVCGKNFQGGTLGPGTIIGSAAFNLFIIVGICILVIPNGEIRRIEHINVFIVTATFSLVAYIWVYVIIGVISVGIIEVWEAVITLLLFPVTVIIAYIADRELFVRIMCYCCRPKLKTKIRLETETEITEFENLRNMYMTTLQDLHKRFPRAHIQSLEKMTMAEVFEKSRKSRAFYKMQATRMLTGGGNLLRHSATKLRSHFDEDSLSGGTMVDVKVQRVYFEPCHYTIMENVGTFQIIVRRKGGNLKSTLRVDYQTEDGTAIAGNDYIPCQGTLEFKANEDMKTIDITVVDDEIFEDEEYFTVLLSNLRVKHGKLKLGYTYEISKTNRATIMILDDDHPGVFQFESASTDVSESCGKHLLAIHRTTGARGKVKIPFKIIPGTAVPNIDFIVPHHKLTFKNEEIYKSISIEIIDDGQYKKDAYFTIELCQPKLIDKGKSSKSKSPQKQRSAENKDIAEDFGQPRLGDIKIHEIHIHENPLFKSVVDKLMLRKNISLSILTTTWKEQFLDAISVNGGQEEEDPLIGPSLISYIMHYLTIFWKVLFAIVPPTDYLDGWLCFGVSIICIGILTALFGDLASSFGCTVGLLDEVVAMTFVAIGTSLPDTFASKYAAISDDTADNSIGNVTGSNAVNVYLGLGLSWSIASVVNSIRGQKFKIQIGSLGFSVTFFCVLACVAFVVIVGRRHNRLGGGELGGPLIFKLLSAGILFGLYFLYVIISALGAYCHIKL